MNNFGLMLDVLRIFLQNANNVIREESDGNVITIKDFVPNYIEAVQSLANGSDRPSEGTFMFEILQAIKMLEDFDYNADEVHELITVASKVAKSMTPKLSTTDEPEVKKPSVPSWEFKSTKRITLIKESDVDNVNKLTSELEAVEDNEDEW